MNIEVRNFEFEPVADTQEIEGTAILFDRESQDLGGFKEIIDRNALNGVDLSDVVLLYNHSSGDVLARSSANTLSFEITDKGVHFRATMPDTTLGRDTLANIRNGNLSGMSFGFTIAEREWTGLDTDLPTQHVISIGKVVEFSITAFPAYKDTDVSTSKRSLDSVKQSVIDEREKQQIKEWVAIQSII